MLLGERGADGLQIVARIEARRNLADVLAERLPVAQECRACENVDLPAGVVDVVFARNLVAGEREEIGERIAEHCAPAMADVHRPRRVGGHVLDVDLLAAAEIGLPVGGALVENRAHDPLPELRLHADIEEPRPGHLDGGDGWIRVELGLERVRDVARLHLGALGEHHGRVAREIAVCGIARRLDLG